MTATQKNELFQYFLLLFNAAPGAVYMEQMGRALAAGTPMPALVAHLTETEPFRSIYPGLANREFSERFVTRLAKSTLTAAVREEAIQELTSALDAGISRADLLMHVRSLLVALSPNDPKWGRLVVQLKNQLETAEFYTSVQLGRATRLEDLQAVVSGITDTQPGITSAVLAYNTGRLIENPDNDGSVGGTIAITVQWDSFAGRIGDALGTVSNVPAGLSAMLVKTGANTAQLSLGGRAAAHAGSDTINNLTVSFSASDFASARAPTAATRSDLAVEFRDLFAIVDQATLRIDQLPTAALTIDLGLDTVTLGNTSLPAYSGSYSEATSVDLSRIVLPEAGAPQGVSIRFLDDAGDNVYRASVLGDDIRLSGGNDTVILNSGADRVRLPAESGSGQITISGFKAGAGGDILDLSAFLVATGKSRVATPIDSNALPPVTPVAWANGDVLLVIGNLTASGVAALFGPTAYLAPPTSARKAAVLSADTIGNATLWYVTNLSGTGVDAIAASEVQQVATLVGLNNLELAGLVAANFE